ncbi:hypothetical protein ACROSR_09790 [Roseovarius tibetensis]|uniref:hypothetical protein n=1 Tax=Roseovarius tibetensis TaxID=2685897 RepID=UPI003D7FB0C8
MGSYAISLTSIPPRYDRLGPVLHSLLAQRPAPWRVILCLPQHPARFDPAPLPALPEGVEILRPARDDGPATKALPAARALAGRIDRLIYCDDDWIMPPDWAAGLLRGGAPHEAVAGAGFDVDRLKRRSHRPPDTTLCDIAQGYAGVLVRPGWLTGPDCTPTVEGWPVDDLWLSAQMARQGISIRLSHTARHGMRLAFADEHALQDAEIDGRRRHAANMACVAQITARYGLWPPL